MKKWKPSELYLHYTLSVNLLTLNKLKINKQWKHQDDNKHRSGVHLERN